MDPEPSGIFFLLQFACLVLYALLSAAESAAQQIQLNRRFQTEGLDKRAEDMLANANRIMQSPSGVRCFMQLLGLLLGGLCMWTYALPLSRTALYTWELPMRPGLAVLLSAVLVMALLTFLMQLFAILLPRRIAAQKPRTTARLLFGLALGAGSLFRPCAKLLEVFSAFLMRLLKMELIQPTEEITEDEIRMLVDVGEEKGAIEEAEREMIENVFEFNNMTAAECMTHRTDMYAIWMGDSTQEIVNLIEQTGLSRFPVYEEDLDHIIGTVSTREFLLNLQRPDPRPLQGILRVAHFVPETVRTDVLFRDMQRNKFHMAIVVDEYGGTSGLITMEDLLEEIVGNIYDEYDPLAQQEIEQLGPNHFRVEGTMDVEGFNEKTGFELPLSEEYDTIGGFLLNQMSSIPVDGSQPEIDYENLHFKVLQVEERRITWVEVNQHATT